MNESVAYWAVVPAAGSGRRMGARTPKQLLGLGPQTVLEHSLDALCAIPSLAGLVLVSQDDPDVDAIALRYSNHGLLRAAGGEERCHSVLNGLKALDGNKASGDDWVLVHDAARPCVRTSDLHKLIETLSGHPVGGLLGVPVQDTIKRTDADHVIQSTVARDNLWHAQTPQMFRLARLREVLEAALRDGFEVTDEASAMEHAGEHPLMVEGHADNLKITRPEDLPLAEMYLRQQGRL
ncbi:2-C-methyl-D-erythritol 4-phosphate cytidylyltransferase [Thiogranum longum]|uniref:2-C-methyl-D-erythritol 4-phosphate cytidylyltransferase n=1 Tax=Thiogranum longum TaxID=1537524 RepID=A0A4R1HE31_9GAMM|nr:2-C-methyl-D-erythritol 4-phosphate cytidylyltransferase [Thiogranum longum]TCK18430.1 2-C-methyl-D-erythritol 4-phosphate cytidylyltransferase [Thiogranum longum]